MAGPCQYADWHEGCGLCLRCGKELTGRKRVWCSNRDSDGPASCEAVWVDNHVWGFASRRALVLAGLRLSFREGAPPKCHACGVADSQVRYEVNHIGPRNGQGYGKGCWNHQDNLEVLCHDCHVAVTRAQRLARKNGGQAVLV